MAHSIQCIVGKDLEIERLANDWVHAQWVRLKHGYSVIPLNADLLDDMNELAGKGTDACYAEFRFLSPSLELVLKEHSHLGLVGYIETDYFGGTGTQSAICYFNGNVLKGPLTTSTDWDHKKGAYLQEPPGEKAINSVLYELGIAKRKDLDAFEFLGLRNYRTNQQLLSTLPKG